MNQKINTVRPEASLNST